MQNLREVDELHRRTFPHFYHAFPTDSCGYFVVDSAGTHLPVPDDLAHVVASWHHVPADVRQAIVAQVRSLGMDGNMAAGVI